MPEESPVPEVGWEALVDALYSAPPEGFVAARDDAVRAARERGDRGFATAAARLRRPTRAAWLVNLLARRRPEQLEGLLGLAGSLADAQRTLDGAALRALSAQRRKLVSAMAREAGQLAREAHEPAGDGLVREVAEILEAALADPVVADEVRSGRLTRTVSYTGFGPPAHPDAAPRPAPPAPPPGPPPAPAGDPSAAEREARRRREEEQRRREQQARRAELADAERDERRAHERRDAAEAARDAAAAEHAAARDRVAALSAELETARERERGAAARTREADAAARAAARDAGTAATRTARARARLEEID